MSNDRYIKDLLCSFVSAGEDMLAFSLYDGKEKTDITYPHFAKDILKAGRYFVEHNISNQHIALVAPNGYDWLVIFFAILASGNVAVLLNPALPGNILLQQLEQADVSMVCGDVSVILQLKKENKKLSFLVFDEINSVKLMSIADIHCAQADETVTLFTTSGTTGRSKFVEVTCTNLKLAAAEYGTIFSDPDITSYYLSLPLFHVAAFMAVIAVFNLRRTLCIGRNAIYMFADMPILNPSMTTMVPSMLDSVVKLFRQTATPGERQKYIGNKMHTICVGGAALSRAVSNDLLNLGYNIYIFYGMTETAGIGTSNKLDMEHISTVGKLAKDMECCIENGELLFKGPYLIKGYYKDPEETAKVIKDGWLHTGDMGYCDEDGYYYITGRKKNVIILSNGENVNPEEIEAKFYECEWILECMVYSDGKGICADVYTNDRDSAAAFIRNYNDDMPMYRQVYKVNYTPEPLPKTGSGKIRRKENIS